MISGGVTTEVDDDCVWGLTSSVRPEREEEEKKTPRGEGYNPESSRYTNILTSTPLYFEWMEQRVLWVKWTSFDWMEEWKRLGYLRETVQAVRKRELQVGVGWESKDLPEGKWLWIRENGSVRVKCLITVLELSLQPGMVTCENQRTEQKRFTFLKRSDEAMSNRYLSQGDLRDTTYGKIRIDGGEEEEKVIKVPLKRGEKRERDQRERKRERGIASLLSLLTFSLSISDAHKMRAEKTLSNRGSGYCKLRGK